MLKLDVPQIMAALDAELGRTEKFSEPPPLVEESKTPLDHVMFLLSKLNWKVGVAGGAVLGIVLVVVLAGLGVAAPQAAATRWPVCRRRFINRPIPARRCRCRQH